MIGKGLLNDVGMNTMMQVMSAERETAVLTLWHAEKGEGAVFFDRGVVVMAAVNELQEQAAFYELSHWDDATYRLTPVERLPATVTDSATILGSQGLATPDSAAVALVRGPQKTLLMPEERREDSAMETELVGLLSRLESGTQAIGRRRNQRKPLIVLQILTRMLNDVLHSSTVQFDEVIDLTHGLQITQNIFPTVQLVAAGNQLNENALIASYNKLGRTERRQNGLDTANAFLDLFETSFFELGTLFHGRDSAENWQETALLFIEELKQTVVQVQF